MRTIAKLALGAAIAFAALVGVGIGTAHGQSWVAPNGYNSCDPASTPYSACLHTDGEFTRCTGSCTPIGECDGIGWIVASASFCYTHDVQYIERQCTSASWFSFDWPCQSANGQAVLNAAWEGFSNVLGWIGGLFSAGGGGSGGFYVPDWSPAQGGWTQDQWDWLHFRDQQNAM